MRGNLLARCGVGEKLEMTSKTYLSLCKEGAEIIMDNVQDTIFGGFAPNSRTAEVLSKALGSRTVLSGSVSQGKDNASKSLQMMERALLTPDELKSLPKGTFIVIRPAPTPCRPGCGCSWSGVSPSAKPMRRRTVAGGRCTMQTAGSWSGP